MNKNSFEVRFNFHGFLSVDESGEFIIGDPCCINQPENEWLCTQITVDWEKASVYSVDDETGRHRAIVITNGVIVPPEFFVQPLLGNFIYLEGVGVDTGRIIIINRSHENQYKNNDEIDTFLLQNNAVVFDTCMGDGVFPVRCGAKMEISSQLPSLPTSDILREIFSSNNCKIYPMKNGIVEIGKSNVFDFVDAIRPTASDKYSLQQEFNPKRGGID